MPMKVSLIWITCLACSAEVTASFSPQPPRLPGFTEWSIQLCATEAATVQGGRIYAAAQSRIVPVNRANVQAEYLRRAKRSPQRIIAAVAEGVLWTGCDDWTRDQKRRADIKNRDRAGYRGYCALHRQSPPLRPEAVGRWKGDTGMENLNEGSALRTAQRKFRRAQKPDAQAFDEIRLVTVPRYKTSGLSGDEWRISVEAQFYRKGQLIHRAACGGRMEVAISLLAARYYEATDNALGYFAGEGTFCDQEGCANIASVVYRMKNKYCAEGHPTPAEGFTYGSGTLTPTQGVIRLFCAAHSRRGDCGLEDSDGNYEILEGTISEPDAADVHKSAFGGVIEWDPKQA